MLTPDINGRRRQNSRLREQLIGVNYDRAMEEEAVLNKVFPPQELNQASSSLNKTLEEQKQEALVVEIFEIGRVSRFCGCSSEEVFHDHEQADSFRKTTARAILFFLVFTLLKQVAAITLSAT